MWVATLGPSQITLEYRGAPVGGSNNIKFSEEFLTWESYKIKCLCFWHWGKTVHEIFASQSRKTWNKRSTITTKNSIDDDITSFLEKGDVLYKWYWYLQFFSMWVSVCRRERERMCMCPCMRESARVLLIKKSSWRCDLKNWLLAPWHLRLNLELDFFYFFLFEA